MNGFGVGNAFGNLKRVLMHRPGIELNRVTPRSLEEFHFDQPVNQEKFVADYDAMLALFQKQGVEVLLVTDILRNDEDALSYIRVRPNMTYTRDLASVFRSGAILMSPFLKGRWGDQWILEKAFQRLGIPVIGAVEAPGYLEGGGVTIIGEDTAVVSLCDRANEAGTRAIRNLILGKDVKYFLEVPLPFGNIHIDGVFMVLDEKLCLIHERTFEVFPCWLYEKGKSKPRFVMFQDFLKQRGFQCIPITDEERKAGHLNVVVTKRSRSAVGFKNAARVGKEMARVGWTLETFDADELFLGKGGAHCMTCPILID
jgi:N-dimethylarginine dimethylaminohydrolase